MRQSVDQAKVKRAVAALRWFLRTPLPAKTAVGRVLRLPGLRAAWCRLGMVKTKPSRPAAVTRPRNSRAELSSKVPNWRAILSALRDNSFRRWDAQRQLSRQGERAPMNHIRCVANHVRRHSRKEGGQPAPPPAVRRSKRQTRIADLVTFLIYMYRVEVGGDRYRALRNALCPVGRVAYDHRGRLVPGGYTDLLPLAEFESSTRADLSRRVATWPAFVLIEVSAMAAEIGSPAEFQHTIDVLDQILAESRRAEEQRRQARADRQRRSDRAAGRRRAAAEELQRQARRRRRRRGTGEGRDPPAQSHGAPPNTRS